MTVEVCRVELLILGSNSLKGKRGVLNSLKAQIRNKFNCSVAETDHKDLWQKSALAIAVVSDESRHADQMIAKIVEFIEGDRRVQLLDYSTQRL